MSPDLCPCRLTRPHPACQLTAVPHNFSLPLAKASVAGLQAKIKTGALLEGPALLTGAAEGTGPHPRESRGFGVCGPQDGWAVGAGPGIRLLWAGWRAWSPAGPLAGWELRRTSPLWPTMLPPGEWGLANKSQGLCLPSWRRGDELVCGKGLEELKCCMVEVLTGAVSTWSCLLGAGSRAESSPLPGFPWEES